MKLFNAPLDPKHRYDEVIDISYITHDCFHFSQKGHALGKVILKKNYRASQTNYYSENHNSLHNFFLPPLKNMIVYLSYAIFLRLVGQYDLFYK